MQEEWKWIAGFEGLYQISNLGRLKSFYRNEAGEIRSVKNDKGWYLTVPLRKNGKNYTRRIHRLVAEAFIRKIPDGYEVHHIDGNKQNNRVDNLKIIESKEHRLLTVLENPNFADGMNEYNMYERPRTVGQYTQDGHLLAKYVNARIASEITGICQRNILQVASKEEYKPNMTRRQAGGFVWKFIDEEVV